MKGNNKGRSQGKNFPNEHNFKGTARTRSSIARLTGGDRRWAGKGRSKDIIKGTLGKKLWQGT